MGLSIMRYRASLRRERQLPPQTKASRPTASRPTHPTDQYQRKGIGEVGAEPSWVRKIRSWGNGYRKRSSLNKMLPTTSGCWVSLKSLPYLDAARALENPRNQRDIKSWGGNTHEHVRGDQRVSGWAPAVSTATSDAARFLWL